MGEGGEERQATGLEEINTRAVHAPDHPNHPTLNHSHTLNKLKIVLLMFRWLF